MVTLGDRELLLGIDRDITQRKMLEEALAHQAMHDPLTGLPNRTFLRSRLAEAIAEARTHKGGMALLFIDLDGFKEVNDGLGHHVGDELLTAVAERVRAVTGDAGTVARLGGDEFALVLPAISRPAAERAMDRLLSAFDSPFDLNGTTIKVAASIGCSVFPAHGNDPAILMRRADIAMYVAKRGPGCWTVFADEFETSPFPNSHGDADSLSGAYPLAG